MVAWGSSSKVWLQLSRPSIKVVTIASWVLAAAMLVLLTAPIGYGHSFDIDPAAIRSDGGYAYITPILAARHFWLPWRADDERGPSQSSLAVYEDGRPLGPAHTPHEFIRKQGGGAFSHWGKDLRDSRRLTIPIRARTDTGMRCSFDSSHLRSLSCLQASVRRYSSPDHISIHEAIENMDGSGQLAHQSLEEVRASPRTHIGVDPESPTLQP
jgi:hypothetical protein